MSSMQCIKAACLPRNYDYDGQVARDAAIGTRVADMYMLLAANFCTHSSQLYTWAHGAASRLL